MASSTAFSKYNYSVLQPKHYFPIYEGLKIHLQNMVGVVEGKNQTKQTKEKNF